MKAKRSKHDRVSKSMKKNKLYRDVAYARIRQRLISLQLSPGTQIDEMELADSLGIGRTPVREALLRIREDMLIESLPQKGFWAKPMSLHNTKSVIEALRIFSMSVTEMAMNRMTRSNIDRMKNAIEIASHCIKDMDTGGLIEANRSFHVNFNDCSANPFLIRGMTLVGYEIDRLVNYITLQNPFSDASFKDYYIQEIDQHLQIVEALEKHDLDELEHAVLHHIKSFEKFIAKFLPFGEPYAE